MTYTFSIDYDMGLVRAYVIGRYDMIMYDEILLLPT